MSDQQTTHFGFRRVPVEEKARQVRAVFDSVVDRYDLMNDLMSLGIHRLWKRAAIELSGVRRGQIVLDLAAGTGDLTERFAGIVGPTGQVISSDINAAMLERGRNRLTDAGVVGNISYVQANAERLPFGDNAFDCISIGFGLRNLTHKEHALEAMLRALKPGGRVLILEFSHPTHSTLQRLYDLYSFKVLPVLGQLVTQDAESYRYLAESIRMHPNQETLQAMLEQVGLERCDYTNLTGGIVAIHRGFKL